MIPHIEDMKLVLVVHTAKPMRSNAVSNYWKVYLTSDGRRFVKGDGQGGGQFPTEYSHTEWRAWVGYGEVAEPYNSCNSWEEAFLIYASENPQL